jgi:peptidoglycan hydrolase CwlO-like protein|tara:strand:- start:865 stop:1071 length:207 start_codon:yes stop_codon:yes gene_type:complete
MFMTKSLKNQLNEDNKKSQSLISKMKKNYEGFQKEIEQLNLKYGNCRNQVDQFDERFDTDDLERINEI